MNTFQEFKKHMLWSTLELTEKTITEIYEAVDHETYSTIKEFKNDYNEEYYAFFYDVNLHSVLEYFKEIIELEGVKHISLFYASGDGLYIGLLNDY